MGVLKEKFASTAIPYTKEVKLAIKEHASLTVDEVKLDQLYGGMRDVISLVTETSLLDPITGISFRGYSIPEIYEKLPSSSIGSVEPTPELVFHLLLTGDIPTEKEIKELTQQWHDRCKIPEHVYKIIDSFPHNAHPMTQFTSAISSMETESVFNKAYEKGIPKDQYWSYIYEDAMNIIASIPQVISYIYNKCYNNSQHIKPDTSLDWAGNMAHMLGDKDPSKISLTKEYLRLHMFLHSDHEGGNASAGTAHVVGSTLASPYASFAAAMHSLSGPLHGLASQNALEWIQKLSDTFSGHPNKQQIEEYIKNSLASGSVVPGYGHAVLRKTDPRFTAQMNFAKKHNLHDNLLETVWNVYDVAPGILGSTGKIKNPYPNVDAHSGVILNHLGFKNPEFYTVLFGASRALGVMAQQIWDRAFMYPIHRPKSVTSKWIKENIIDKK